MATHPLHGDTGGAEVMLFDEANLENNDTYKKAMKDAEIYGHAMIKTTYDGEKVVQEHIPFEDTLMEGWK